MSQQMFNLYSMFSMGIILVMMEHFLVSTSAQEMSNDGLMDCPLCADPTFVPQNPGSVFVAGSNTFACETAFGLDLKLPAENCTFWQSRGSTICACSDQPLESNSCRLCSDGSSLPIGLLEATPEKNCVQVQQLARLDAPELCELYQDTFGIYCECPVASETASDRCRLCGDSLLPDPVKILAGPSFMDPNTTMNTSCVELEFEANLEGAICSEYQELAAAECCPEEPAPTDSPVPAAATTFSSPLVGFIGIGLALFLIAFA